MNKDLENIKYNYNFIKGHLAEAIIEQLFITLGMEIYKAGVEIQAPRLTILKRTGKLEKKALQRLSASPDFYITRENKKTGAFSVHELEVKYRNSGKIRYDALKQYKDDDIIFLFLDNKNIYCAENKDIKIWAKHSEELNFSNESTQLKDCKLLDFIDTERRIIESFCAFLPVFLKSIKAKYITSNNIEKLYNAYIPNLTEAFFNSSKEKT